ncbi:hypothetical protein V4R08_08995 [Nitrobacter sp. NHB1]|uniref:hypothetical protein n=1 Tax=Nitrobacter sp. NHB1 TaxID=3119830 RepID=UPI002FFE27C9
MSGAEVAGTENVNATEPASSAPNRIFDRIIQAPQWWDYDQKIFVQAITIGEASDCRERPQYHVTTVIMFSARCPLHGSIFLVR